MDADVPMSKNRKRAKALKKAAKRIKRMGVVWGGDKMWITSGDHIAELVSGLLEEWAEEAE